MAGRRMAVNAEEVHACSLASQTELQLEDGDLIFNDFKRSLAENGVDTNGCQGSSLAFKPSYYFYLL